MGRHVEPFHARSVLEATGEDSFVNFDRNVALESSAVAESTLLTASAMDHPIQIIEHFVDRTGGHKIPTTLLVDYKELGELLPAEVVTFFEDEDFRSALGLPVQAVAVVPLLD